MSCEPQEIVDAIVGKLHESTKDITHYEGEMLVEGRLHYIGFTIDSNQSLDRMATHETPAEYSTRAEIEIEFIQEWDDEGDEFVSLPRSFVDMVENLFNK